MTVFMTHTVFVFCTLFVGSITVKEFVFSSVFSQVPADPRPVKDAHQTLLTRFISAIKSGIGHYFLHLLSLRFQIL